VFGLIYFDNSATTLTKPPEVAEAVAYAINHLGNAGRSFYDTVMDANREIFKTRQEIAKLIGLANPLNVAFTSSSTDSLNLVINSLIQQEDSVITSVAEHNSVLRPLYLKGCELSFLGCDEKGNLLAGTFEKLLKPATKFLVCTHGSNVTGNITEVQTLYRACKANDITMILDISQTFGSFPVNINMADIFCFTGHKCLYGPQGTGGIIVNGDFDFNIVKTGGSGVNSFERFQSRELPDIFEVGTLNCHGLFGLQKGVQFISKTGIDRIQAKERRLLSLFYEGIKNLEGVTIYGDFTKENRLPVISINVEGFTSGEVSAQLWQDYLIATRAGSHCAPLLHKHFGTVNRGMTRFSFSFFNTEEEIGKGVLAVKNITGAS